MLSFTMKNLFMFSFVTVTKHSETGRISTQFGSHNIVLSIRLALQIEQRMEFTNREDTKPTPAHWSVPAHKRDLPRRRKENLAQIRQKQKRG